MQVRAHNVAAQVDIVRRGACGLDPDKDPAFLASAEACLRENGVVLLEGVIPRAVIDNALRHFKQAYSNYMRPGQNRLLRNFQDDKRRAQIPIAPEGPVASPYIIANPIIMALAKVLMGEKIIAGEMGGVISHPGSKPQYTHRDSMFLFGGTPIDLKLPWWSLTIIIPLVDAPLECGPTEYWPGSHLRLDGDAVIAHPPECTAMQAGSIFAYSGQTLHRGGANRSNIVRPVIYITYQRPWYLERSGYEDKPQIRINHRMLNAMAPEHSQLFSWALHLNRADTLDEFLMRWAVRLKGTLGRRTG